MTCINVFLDSAVLSFYSQLAEAVRLPFEQVISDALFKLAGELSLEALRQQE